MHESACKVEVCVLDSDQPFTSAFVDCSFFFKLSLKEYTSYFVFVVDLRLLDEIND